MKVKVLVTTKIQTILDLEISDKDYAALDEEIMFETGGRYYASEMAHALAHSENSICRNTIAYSNVESHSLWKE